MVEFENNVNIIIAKSGLLLCVIAIHLWLRTHKYNIISLVFLFSITRSHPDHITTYTTLQAIVSDHSLNYQFADK